MVAIHRRVEANDIGTNAHSILMLWMSFQIISGHILLPILAAIFMFSKKARRHPTLINLCICWIISGIVSCLLFYSGAHEGPEPSLSLCLMQGSLIYAIPPMTATSVFALVFQVWLGVSNHANNKSNPKWRTFRTAVLVAAPYIVFGVWSTACAWLAVRNPDRLSRNRRFFYCSLEHEPFSNGIGVFTALVLIATTVFEVWLGIILHRNWRDVRGNGGRGDQPLDFIVRVICFGVYVVMGMVFSIMSVWAPKSPVPDLWIASVGLMVVLIFGTQKPVLQALLFWKKDTSSKFGDTTAIQSSDTAADAVSTYKA